MLPRLIATDLDGTLLKSRGDLSGRTIAALRAAHDPLFGFALATDRWFTQEAGFIERMPVHHGDDLMVSHMGTEAVELGPAGDGVRRRDQRPGDVRVRRPVSRRANAPPLVRATATPVTESNDDDVFAIIRDFRLAATITGVVSSEADSGLGPDDIAGNIAIAGASSVRLRAEATQEPGGSTPSPCGSATAARCKSTPPSCSCLRAG